MWKRKCLIAIWGGSCETVSEGVGLSNGIGAQRFATSSPCTIPSKLPKHKPIIYNADKSASIKPDPDSADKLSHVMSQCVKKNFF